MNFNQAEKLAIVKAIDEVILADDRVDAGEIAILNQLMHILQFDRKMIEDARNIDAREGLAILNAMPDYKKRALALLLEEMANADGRVDEVEIELILNLYNSIGIQME
jgi:uncharacterized tellurite resistance protein B-like protein